MNNDFAEEPGGIKIFVHSNGVHCDVILPAKNNFINWFEKLPAGDCESVDTTFGYVAFGWGDKGFYLETPQWSDLKLSTAFKAAFFMSSTAMHVNWCRNEPSVNTQCKMISISPEQYQRLVNFIRDGFRTNEFGKAEVIAHPGYTPYDKFYEANGTYSLCRTCNVWTGQALGTAGIKVGCWTPFDWNLMNSIK